MGKKKKKKALTPKEKAELIVDIVSSIASLIAALATLLKD